MEEDVLSLFWVEAPVHSQGDPKSAWSLFKSSGFREKVLGHS